MVFGYVFWAQMDTNPLTQNLGFNISFHPYIHDQDLEQAFDTLLFGGIHVCILDIGIWLSLMVFSFGVKQITIHQLTQNLGFNIPFHPYVHDHNLEQAICTATCGICMYLGYGKTATFRSIRLPISGSDEHQSTNLLKS